MTQIFSLTLIWALYSTAGALTCMTCTDQSCSSTTSLTCSSETMCITATIRATQPGTSVTQLYKACAASSLCPATGSSTFSVNLGSQSAIASAQCCNTDNCNSQTLPAPTTPAANSLQCIVCDPTTSQCTTPVTCSGVETNCISATLNDGKNTFPALGCASPNTCTAASNLGSLPFMKSVGSITSGPTCCTGSLCNNPSTTTTAAPTTTTTTAAPTTTTTTAAPTTTTTTTTTAAPTTTTTTAAPTTTTTTAAPTTTTTTTTTAAPTTTTTTTTTAAPTTTTTTTTTTSGAFSFRLGFLHLLFVCLYLLII
ncbi:integumentary mucin C.1-like [Poeciliopsis prolifica]|uniref:integumentary mucin C.1-like n=1 Tax=Poeciliopsis prolifica TaxID=188132 RepID=UPI0024136C27|nr:integumentary mucin C.1-like [Poeciliopsis prolifica]